LIGLGIREGHHIASLEGSNRQLDHAAVGIHGHRVSFEKTIAFEQPKPGDDANSEKNAPASPAIANGGVRDGLIHCLCLSESVFFQSTF
jgi:hypothetical protein